ncbi:tRNA pseudouridine(55) synthase TruB [Chloroflexota bacterium]
MDGILNIDKPWGETSFRIVARIRRLTGERRVGHGGTLDPAATGVLPVCLGQGTRVSQFFSEATKSYRAQIEFGIITDTYDACGEVTDRKDPSYIKLEQLESALALFRGEIKQTPPMYSAVKHEGRRLYELARQGIEVERKSRPAMIYDLQLTGWEPPVATVEVVCGKGTYIRALAHDLGQALGCGAVLKNLVRLRCGPFDINEAVSMPEVEESIRYGYWQRFIYPIDTVLLPWAAIVVGDDTGETIRNGGPVTLTCDDPVGVVDAPGRCRAYTREGSLLGLLQFNQETGQWHPVRVFR